MNNAEKQKAINGFIEYYDDTLFVRGKIPMNRKEKRRLSKIGGSMAWRAIVDSADGQFLSHYTDTPKESRIKALDENFFTSVIEKTFYDPMLRFIYLTLWHVHEGIKLDDEFKAFIGQELSEILDEITRQSETDGKIELDSYSLGLSPGSIAGVNNRLKAILKQHSINRGENGSKPDYEQDMSATLWKCSEGSHLDEFEKKLSDKGDVVEKVAKLRQMFKDTDKKLIRGILLRILRKTIEDLPDIKDAIIDREAQQKNKVSIIRDKSGINDNEPLFDGIASQDGNNVEEYLEQQEQLAEWKRKTQMFTTRELELYQSELDRLKANKTREEYYGNPNQAKSVTQQLKYIKCKYSE